MKSIGLVTIGAPHLSSRTEARPIMLVLTASQRIIQAAVAMAIAV